jgi:AcrR family transcriptional regulator
MRITAEAKRATRGRILEAAHELFSSQGFDETTTRDISRRAGTAAATLFNYFSSKEAIAARLITDQLDRARADFEKKRRAEPALDEDLFLHVAAGLRRLRPHRKYLRPVVQALFHPALKGAANEDTEAIRVRHLESVGRLFAGHGVANPLSPIDEHLYWTLYCGVLAFWTADSSPHQEDTLALLDQSLRLFVNFLDANPKRNSIG